MTRSNDIDSVDWKTLTDLYEESSNHIIPEPVEEHISKSSINTRELQFIGKLIEQKNIKSVIEFGSGVSTLFFSTLLDDGVLDTVVAFDDSPHYIQRTTDLLGSRSKVNLVLAPIGPYYFRGKLFATYSKRKILENLCLDGYDLILIDGPLGLRYGREAALYIIYGKLKDSSLILLDDANRLPEKKAMVNWQKVWSHGLFQKSFSIEEKHMSCISLIKKETLASRPFGIWEILVSWVWLFKLIILKRVRREN